MQQMNLTEAFGSGLADRLRTAIASASLSPVEANEVVGKIVAEATSTHEVVVSLALNLESLRVRPEKLPAGEFEFGMLLPEGTVDHRLDTYAKEVKHLNSLARTIQELGGANPSEVRLRGASASSWVWFLSLAPFAAKAMIDVVEKVLGLYKSVLEIREIKQRLTDREMSQTILDGIQTDIDKRIKEGLSTIADEVVAKLPKSEDVGRRNELTIKLCRDLKWLAIKLEKGAIVEVVAALPAKITDTEQEAEPKGAISSKDIAKLAEYVNQKTNLIADDSRNLRGEVFGELTYDGDREDEKADQK